MVSYYAPYDPDPESRRFFTITFPDIPWAVSQGENEPDGRGMALDLLRTALAEHIRKGGPRYSPLQVELYRAFQKSGMRKSDLARALGISKTNIDRLFTLSRKSRLDQIEAAFVSFGKRVDIEIRNAA